MKAKHRRLWFVLSSLVAIGLGVSAILYAFSDNLIFFYTPSQLAEKRREAGFDASRAMRIGGLVKVRSVKQAGPQEFRFVVTDFQGEVPVFYRGFVPALFREGQGVVAQGTLDEKGVLQATQILAKHDENYMPREVMESLKKSGRWRDGRMVEHPSDEVPKPAKQKPVQGKLNE